MARALRLIGRGLALLGVLFAVLAVRAVTSSRAQLQRGDVLRDAGNLDGAIIAYRRSARWYAPGNPYVPQALDRLEAIATEAEAAGEGERAIVAWRSMRGAILATRSVYMPHAERLARAEAGLEQALATPERETRRRPAGVTGEPRPRLVWTLVLLAGWIAWTGGAFLFAQRALDEEDRVRGKSARLWGSVVLIGFGLFVIGMALA